MFENAQLIDKLKQSYTDEVGTAVLKDPFQVPQQLVLKGSIPAVNAATHFFFNDALGLSAVNGSIVQATGIAMTSTSVATVAIIKEFLKTHALVVGGYNFNSSDANQLSNNVKVIYSAVDGNTQTSTLFSAQSVSNLQNNPNLLNVDQPFVFTNACALDINVASDAVLTNSYTFTLKIAGAVPYGVLADYLRSRAIPARSKIGG